MGVLALGLSAVDDDNGKEDDEDNTEEGGPFGGLVGFGDFGSSCGCGSDSCCGCGLLCGSGSGVVDLAVSGRGVTTEEEDNAGAGRTFGGLDGFGGFNCICDSGCGCG